MAIPRRTLTSLPSDVLLEILKLVLLDTPRSPQRAAVLRTCSLLLDLGLPLLYRVVDLTGMEKRSTLLIHWKRLFGAGGLFAKGKKTGRGLGVGSFVRELRLGGGDHWEMGRWEAFQVAPLNLPRCSTLFFESAQLYSPTCTPLHLILSSIPVTNLVVSYRAMVDRFPFAGSDLPLTERLGIHAEPWKNLERIVFRGCLWYDKRFDGSVKPSCSELSFKTLVVEVAVRWLGPNDDSAFTLFLEPKLEKGERFLEDVGRIEFRISGEYANEMEEKFKEDVRKRVARGLSSLEKRLLPLFVFVSEEGEERRFEGLA